MLFFSKRFSIIIGAMLFIAFAVIASSVFAAPARQFPTNSVLVISDPAPSEPGAPGQFPERTLLQSTFIDPDPNWKDYDFNDSGWGLSYLSITQPGWGQPLNPPPATSADFIWGGVPGPGDGNGRFEIPASPAPQYVFIRKNFCVPINAVPNSITPNNPFRLQTAATPGDANLYYNGFALVNFPGGAESDVVSYNIPTGVSDAFTLARKRGRNTLAMFVNDARTDANAGVAFELEIGYAIDPAAITINAPAFSVANTPSSFSETNDGLSGDTPYTYAWDFGDGTPVDTAAAPSHIYLNPGLYAIALTMTDNFGCPSAPVTLPHTAQAAPPGSVAIAGPDTGALNTGYAFTATVSPPTTSTPVTYTWTATGQSGVIQTNNLSDIINYSWSTFGAKIIAVIAQNAAGSVSDTHTIFIQPDALSGVSITGPTSGLSGQSYSFTADAAPANATQPITYSWQSGGGSPATATGVDGLSDAQSFSWNTPGTYTLVVTANNPAGIPVNDAHVIIINAAIVLPANVSIAGPVTGAVGVAYTFDAAVSPLTTTLPITYNWQVTDLGAFQTPAATSLTDQRSFAWSTPGMKSINVTAVNAGGSAVGGHTITVNVLAPTSVSVSGPAAGLVNTNYTFDATVSPLTTTLPITYNWQVTDLGSAQVTINQLTNQQTFNWVTPGVKNVNVTATNAGGSVVGGHSITITVNVVAPTSINVSGPTSGNTGQALNFNAAVLPGSVSQPLTYTWQATEQTTVVRQVNAAADLLSFTWNNPGLKTITVTAENAAGSVLDTRTVTINVAVIPPTGVTISGPTSGRVGQTLTFVADVSPANASTPLTYVWTADGQAKMAAAVAGHTKTYTWNSPGTYVISVTAGNRAGSAADSHTVVISPRDDDDDDNAAPPAPAPAPTAAPAADSFPTILPETGGGDSFPVAFLLIIGVLLVGVGLGVAGERVSR